MKIFKLLSRILKFNLLLTISFSLNSWPKINKVIDEIKKDGSLKICTAGGFIPFSSYSNQGWEGFDINMMKAFSKHLNTKLEIINYSIDGIIPALNSKKCNLISTGLVITDERKKSVLFSNSYFESNIIYLYKKNNELLNKIKNVNELNNSKFKIGVKIGTTNDFFATKNLNKANILKFNEYGDLINSVRNLKVDSIIIDSTYGIYIEKKFPDVFQFKKVNASEQHFGVAARLADKDLIEEFNNFLSKWKSSGNYDIEFHKFF